MNQLNIVLNSPDSHTEIKLIKVTGVANSESESALDARRDKQVLGS